MSGHMVAAPPIRIVLVALSGLLRDVIRGILDEQRDMTVVADVPDCKSLRNVLPHGGADLAVYGLNCDDLLEVCPQLFDEHPAIKVLTVRDDGRRGFMWQLRPASTALGEISAQHLVETIRKVVHQ